jgi:hypothetical protein
LKLSTKRRLTVAVIVFITLAVVVAIGLATNSFSSKNATPTPTATAYTIQEKQTIAQNTTGLFFDTLMANVSEQIGEEKASIIKVTPQTVNNDAEGKEATVAILASTGIDSSFDYQKNVEVLKAYVEEIKKQTKGPWIFVQSDDAEFEDSEVLTALKIFEDTEKPENPAIIEISYMQKTAEDGTVTYEIYFSSTIY